MISHQALVHLKLDEVWWLVSPQNPLKPANDMASQADRIKWAQGLARHPLIRVTNVEGALGTQYTSDTLMALTARCPDTHFVWLMGADNLIQLPKWHNWQDIIATVPIAVFGRPAYSLQAMTSHVAFRYAKYRLGAQQAGRLATAAPPAWTFIHYRHDPLSATLIRQSR